MKRKPDILWHMTSWGFVSGTLLSVLYGLFLSSFEQTSLEIMTELFKFETWYFGVSLGGWCGIVVGFFSGGILYPLFPAKQEFTEDYIRSVQLSICLQVD